VMPVQGIAGHHYYQTAAASEPTKGAEPRTHRANRKAE